MNIYTHSLYSFGTRKNCHKILNKSIIVPIHKETYFYQELLLMQMKLYEDVNVALGPIDKPSFIYLVFGKYFKRNGSIIMMYL